MPDQLQRLWLGLTGPPPDTNSLTCAGTRFKRISRLKQAHKKSPTVAIGCGALLA
jgi:hypothetical protein